MTDESYPGPDQKIRSPSAPSSPRPRRGPSGTSGPGCWPPPPWLSSCIASVAVDLPSHTTVAADTADQTSIMQQINGDIDGCSYGVKETFTIYQDPKKGSLSPSDLAEAPSMMRDDQTACSFTSSEIYDLSNVEGTGTPAGKNIGNVVNVVTLWATSDALGAIEDIQTLDTDPGDPVRHGDLSKQEVALAQRPGQADAS